MNMLESRTLRCPWCGEKFETLIERSEDDSAYTEDCPVCCRPILMQLSGDDAHLDVERE